MKVTVKELFNVLVPLVQCMIVDTYIKPSPFIVVMFFKNPVNGKTAMYEGKTLWEKLG
jgi:hypothetical protein